MPLLNLFSKRMKHLRGELPDIYRYDDLPNKLRVQVIHLWRETLGISEYDGLRGWNSAARTTWLPLNRALKKERGVFVLNTERKENPEEEIAAYFLCEEDFELARTPITSMHLKN
jgi:hypothetical protein